MEVSDSESQDTDIEEQPQTESIVTNTAVRKVKPMNIGSDPGQGTSGSVDNQAGISGETGHGGQIVKRNRKRKLDKDTNFDVVLDIPNATTDRIANKIKFGLETGPSGKSF